MWILEIHLARRDRKRWRRARRLYGTATGAVTGVAGQRPSRGLTGLFISRARNAVIDDAFRQKAIRILPG